MTITYSQQNSARERNLKEMNHLTIDSFYNDLEDRAKNTKIYDKLDNACISPCIYNELIRKEANVKARTLICLDYDDTPDLNDIQTKLKDYSHFIFTTFSSGTEKNGIICDRYRVIIPLNAEVLPTQWNKDKCVKYFSDLIVSEIDVSSFVISQLAFLPATNLNVGIKCKFYRNDSDNLFDYFETIDKVEIVEEKEIFVPSNETTLNTSNIDFDKLIEALKTKTQIHQIKTHAAGATTAYTRHMMIGALLFLGCPEYLIADLDTVMKTYKKDATSFKDALRGAKRYGGTEHAGIIFKLLNFKEKNDCGLLNNNVKETPTPTINVDEVQSKLTVIELDKNSYITQDAINKIDYTNYKVSQLLARAGIGKSYFSIRQASLTNKLIIAAPTKLLCDQFAEDIVAINKNGNVKDYTYHGDIDKKDFKLNKDIIVCCHGSLKDLTEKLVENKTIDEYSLFIDESHTIVTTATKSYRADQMTDVINAIPKYKHTLLITATPVDSYVLENLIEHTYIVSSATDRSTTYTTAVVTSEITITDSVALQMKKSIDNGNFPVCFLNATDKDCGKLANLITTLATLEVKESDLSIVNSTVKGGGDYEEITNGSVKNKVGLITTSLLVEGVSIKDTRNIDIFLIGNWTTNQCIQIENRFRGNNKIINIFVIQKKEIEKNNIYYVNRAVLYQELKDTCDDYNRMSERRFKIYKNNNIPYQMEEYVNGLGSCVEKYMDENNCYKVKPDILLFDNFIYELNAKNCRANYDLLELDILSNLEIVGSSPWTFKEIELNDILSEQDKETTKAIRDANNEAKTERLELIKKKISCETKQDLDESIDCIKAKNDEEHNFRKLVSSVANYIKLNCIDSAKIAIDYMDANNITKTINFNDHKRIQTYKNIVNDKNHELNIEFTNLQNYLLSRVGESIKREEKADIVEKYCKNTLVWARASKNKQNKVATFNEIINAAVKIKEKSVREGKKMVKIFVVEKLH